MFNIRGVRREKRKKPKKERQVPAKSLPKRNHEGNTEEENYTHVVFEGNIYVSNCRKNTVGLRWGGGGHYSARPRED
jgi:hypothetical protein